MNQITKQIISKAPRLWENRRKEIISNLDKMEIDVYREFDEMRKKNVPLKERLQLVDLNRQARLTAEKDRLSQLRFFHSYLYQDIVENCTSEEELQFYLDNLEKIIYYYFELFGICTSTITS